MTLDKPAYSITATVLGAGTMGAGIAAHLAAAGCTVHLLDIVPAGAAGRPESRSQIAQKALKALGQARPPALMGAQVAERILPGNLDDHLDKAVAASDLVIEAVVERLDVKVELFQRVAQHAAPHTILASNTSGISIDAIAAGLPSAAQSRFLGLHFFNPPRWMYLLEVIPGEKTAPSVVAQAAQFCDRVLGKGIVLCRDTPNFIGNRIGIAEMLLTFAATAKYGLTIEQVDFLNGPLLGRPKTGSYRLGDLVGIDVVGHVIDNLQRGLSGDPKSPHFDPLYAQMVVPDVVARLIKDKRLGDKTGAGFYKKERAAGGQSTILSLDLNTFEYRARLEPSFPELEQQQKLLELPARVGEVLRGTGQGSAFLRDVMLPLINYSAYLAGTICATAAEIDEAMKWGYGWQLGPFEILDAAGVPWVCEQLRASNQDVAQLLLELEAQHGSVYRSEGGQVDVFVQGHGLTKRALPSGVILLDQLGKGAVIHENRTARLVDLGDGVACLEFRSKANILDDGVVQLITQAPQLLVDKGYLGMVLGNQAEHFCRGANLMHIAGLIGRKDFAGVEHAIRALQDAYMNLRHGPIPVVAAPIGQTLGGGTEACLHCAEIQA
ncbi:MAG TPA: 3-hydroxyacyl-CoA dehydrogenase NAD-binding domain-containing protein, partial [Polyangiaceae bacterium]|nr:3-hydroxyacyl-CoA dehydrogenase NAD-binding domain-containing protein [Polyangiaceae bacterium]